MTEVDIKTDIYKEIDRVSDLGLLSIALQFMKSLQLSENYISLHSESEIKNKTDRKSIEISDFVKSISVKGDLPQNFDAKGFMNDYLTEKYGEGIYRH